MANFFAVYPIITIPSFSENEKSQGVKMPVKKAGATLPPKWAEWRRMVSLHMSFAVVPERNLARHLRLCRTF